MAIFNGDIQDNVINGTIENDVINGFAGDDQLFGDAGNDQIVGDLGNDILRSGDGDDTLLGGPGNDRLIFSGTGHNTGDGGAGIDTVEIDLSHLGADVQVTTFWQFHVGALTNYTIRTSDQSASTRIDGYERLIIRSGAGNDDLRGTYGKDRIFGNDGDDSFGDFRFGGNDIFHGGAGDDAFVGNTRHVRLFGGSGEDTFEVRYQPNAIQAKGIVHGGSGQDLLRLSLAGNADRTISFESGARNVMEDGFVIDKVENLSLTTGNGKDTLTLKATKPGHYRFDAGLGKDHLELDLSEINGFAEFSYYRNNQGVGTWQTGSETIGFTVLGVETLTITGNDQRNFFTGGRPSSEFFGGGGNDGLTGGELRDRLYGEAGNDYLNGRHGNDLLNGGTGNDNLKGDFGNDTLIGGTGDDRLMGDSGDDVLNGGSGRDRLDGGAGNDDLRGGGGRDLFIFREGDGTDRVLDFELGVDRIDLRRDDIDRSDLQFTQENGYVEITLINDNSIDPTTIQVLNLTVAELDTGANFLF